MARQNVQHDASGMHVVGQGLRACRFNRFQPIGQDGSEDIDHLAVTAGLAFELFAHTPYGKGQFPFFEGRTVTQSAWFAHEHRQIMQRIIDRFAATEGAFVLTDNLPVLPTFQPIRIGTDLHGATNCAGIDGITVVVEPDEAGL